MPKITKEMKGLFGKPSIQLGIGDLSRISGVSQSQLRYWESKHYISPIQSSAGKNRKYQLLTIVKVVIIKKFLDDGFTLPVAVRKSLEHKEMMDVVRKVNIERFISMEEIDGDPAINMGPLEDDPGYNVFAIVKNGTTILRLIPNK